MALVKHNNNSISAVTSMASLSTGSMTLIKEQTANSSASISFVDGSSDVVLDSTYPIYKFEFINMHPSAGNDTFRVNFRDGGTNYDAVKTSTYFRTSHRENDTETVFSYAGGGDLAQGTGTQQISGGIGNNNDQSGSGYLFLFNPSSTTFVKHFMAEVQIDSAGVQTEQSFTAGYCNTTTAIDGVQFSMSSGNIDSGTIKLYGIKDS